MSADTPPTPETHGVLVVPADLPPPYRSWFQLLDGQPTLFVRRDLLGELTDIAREHYRHLPRPAA